MNNAQVIVIFIMGLVLGSVLTVTVQQVSEAAETNAKCTNKGGMYISGKCLKVEELK